MKGFGAFYKKEIMELFRSYRGMILGGLTLVFGIMSPLIAKVTPWLMEHYSESLKDQGITVGKVTVSAKDVWGQFDKNYSILLIVVLILFSGAYVGEYAKGTLIPLFTKGLGRSAALFAKLALQLLAWTVCLAGSFGITWGYTAYYWDNSTVQNLPMILLCFWLAGVFFLTLMALFSSFCNSTIQVLLGTGGVYFLLTLLGMVESLQDVLPTKLMGCASMLNGETEPGDFLTAILVAAAASLIFTVLAVVITKRRKL